MFNKIVNKVKNVSFDKSAVEKNIVIAGSATVGVGVVTKMAGASVIGSSMILGGIGVVAYGFMHGLVIGETKK